MRSRWKGYFFFSFNDILANSSIIPYDYVIGTPMPVYNGKQWSIVLYKHLFMSGFKVKNFVQSKFLGNIHRGKRKTRKKVGSRRKK